MLDMTEKERSDAQMAVLYDLQLDVKASEKESYTKQELLDLIDTKAKTKREK